MRIHVWFQIFLIPFYQILFGVDAILVSGQCQISQQSILIQMKNNLRFNSSLSTKLVTWNPIISDCCTWGGVTCSISSQVIGLDLSNETISDGIDDSSVLFSLKNLESLNLAANKFDFRKIPSRFGNLVSLLYLNLSGSGFSGQIPGELSLLTRLEVLDLSEMFSFSTRSLKLEKPNLASLVQNLTRLRGLYLDNVNISAQKSDWCPGLSSSLPDLEVLSLSNCQLSGPLDDSLAKLQSLSVIRLSLNDLSAPVPDFFASFKNLTVLNLVVCNLIGKFPEKVLESQKLQILDISVNTKLYGSLPDFPINGSLQRLLVSHTNFSGGIPESIGNLKNLSRVDLRNNNFSGRIPKSIERLEELLYLDLSSNNFIGEIPSFQLCKNVTHIDLSRNGLSGMIPSTHFQDLHKLVSVDVTFNAFSGSIPSSLFSLQKMQQIQLSNNNFDGLLPNFANSSASLLNTLDLSSNKLEGEIPRSFFELGWLSILLLSSNNLSGVIEITDFQSLSNLTTLDLSFNSLSIKTSSNITLEAHLPKFSSLKLASCNLQKFPNLKNQSRLFTIDLSNNKIEGEIPSWIWGIGNGGLSYMNLSYNRLTGLENPYIFPDLTVLDLHFNRLSGVIPIPPQTATFIDYSNNLFNSSLPESIGRNLNYTFFFLVSNNLLTGEIPETICNATYLNVLDLSNNRLSGRIPQCLFELGGSLRKQLLESDVIEYRGRLGVLNLANNSLSGRIEGTFPRNCGLNTLDLHGNSLEGEIPKSLVNCSMLQVLNIGNNMINDTYPCYLGNNTNLRVLVLRSNRFHGSMRCSEDQHNWSKLQILDIAHNSLSGAIPTNFFTQWGAMMTDENQASKKYLSFMVLPISNLYYQDTVTVTIKGLELELVKILTIFTSIDISSNHFSGEIPNTIGQLKALYLLNVSHNAFTGSIPRSLQNLNYLESLDMSSNKLTEEIPNALTNLSFLSSFNVSYNQLKGRIPTGSQFQTFENTSYLGNNGLCGFPLDIICTSSVVPLPSSPPSSDTSGNGYNWQSTFYGMGVGVVLSIVIPILHSLNKRRKNL